MPETIDNPTPKSRFQGSSVYVSDHRHLVDTPAFVRAADAAMLEYQRRLVAQTSGQYEAMATGLKLQGALEFLQQLRMLAEPEAKGQTPLPVPSLNHRA